MGRIAARVGRRAVRRRTRCTASTRRPRIRLRKRAPVLAAEWIAARFSDLELYQSAEDLAWARRLHVARPGRSLHLGNGIDLSQFTPGRAGRSGCASSARSSASERTSSSSARSVGWCARRATRSSSRRHERCGRAFRTPGSWWWVRAIRTKRMRSTADQIERAGDAFVFTGWREDVADLMASMDVFVLPSWREGMPRSAIEAAASGLPLVLTDIRGCREVARDGVEGFLVPVRDPARLADAIVRLLEEPDAPTRDGRRRSREGRGALRRAPRRRHGGRRHEDAPRGRPGDCRRGLTARAHPSCAAERCRPRWRGCTASRCRPRSCRRSATRSCAGCIAR